MTRLPWRAALLRRAPRLFLRWLEPDPRALGQLGEELAARYLVDRGWRLLGRRLATPYAEIDLVARRAGNLVCVEVKSARSAALPRPKGGEGRLDLRWRPGLRLDRRRLERQRRAGRYLARHLVHGPCQGGRVDLIEVFLTPGSGRVRVIHHADLERPLWR